MTIQRKAVGPGASALKYDILTALLVTATRGDAVTARLAMRLSLIITARFNWRTERFSVALKEIARMWGVTERTAKRDMAQMRARRWIVTTVPSARGRVAQHRVEFDVLLRETMPNWDAVGPDFVARMSDAPEPQDVSNVIPLHREAMPTEDGSGWGKAAVRLREQDPATFDAWFAPLKSAGVEGACLTLIARNRFQADYVRTHFMTRLLAAMSAENAQVREIRIESDLPC